MDRIRREPGRCCHTLVAALNESAKGRCSSPRASASGECPHLEHHRLSTIVRVRHSCRRASTTRPHRLLRLDPQASTPKMRKPMAITPSQLKRDRAAADVLRADPVCNPPSRHPRVRAPRTIDEIDGTMPPRQIERTVVLPPCAPNHDSIHVYRRKAPLPCHSAIPRSHLLPCASGNATSRPSIASDRVGDASRSPWVKGSGEDGSGGSVLR